MKPIHIAIVEDDADDRFFIKLAFEGITSDLRLTAFPSGVEFLDYLQKGRDLPEIILTDIRMPVVNGFDVIQYVKQDGKTQNIPVMVLSTSSSEEDVERAKKLGASGYFIKPTSLEAYHQITAKVIEAANSRFLAFYSRFVNLRDSIHNAFFQHGWTLG